MDNMYEKNNLPVFKDNSICSYFYLIHNIKLENTNIFRGAFFVLLFMFVKTSLNAQRPTFTINGVPAVHNTTYNICQGTRPIFINTTPVFQSARWRTDNASPSGSTNNSVQIRFDSLGNAKVVLIKTDFSNRVDSSWVFFRITNVYPDAGFTFSPTTLECGSSDYRFTDTSKGAGLTYRWLFGDGRSSTLKNPVHVYDSALGISGSTTYTVSQIVTNQGGCSDTATKSLTVRNVPDIRVGNADPNVAFGLFNGVQTFRYCNNVPSFTFSFQNQSSTLGSINSYKIKWGDGTPDTSFASWPAASIIQHTFPIGNNSMVVEVLGANGCPNKRTYNVFVGSTPAGGFASPGNTEVCAPDTLQFNISNTANNPPGTLYTVTVNDGTPVKVFNHPAPPTVTHLFERSSCGVQSSNGPNVFTNSFFALLNIENPCGATSVNVIPIYVSGKPNPAIAITPAINLCVGPNATVRNSGDYGGLITSTGGGGSTCDNKGKVVWTLSPSTGYTISGGTLGNLNNNPLNGLAWTTGSESFNINFINPGTYTVWQYLYNERCGIDSIGTEICVRNRPSSGFFLNQRKGCIGDTISLTNTSAKGPCGGDTYQWTVRYVDPLLCGGAPDYSFVGGTNDRSESPLLRFGESGKYIVELVVTAVASACSSPVFRDTIVIKEKAIVAMNAASGICAGNSITPTAVVNNCYSDSAAQYLWDFQGGSPASSVSANPGAVYYAIQGTYPIRLKVTNDCGLTEVVRSLVVGSRPVAMAGPDVTVCSNQAANIGSPPSPGVVYTWTPATGVTFPNQSQSNVTRTYNGPSNDTIFQYVIKASLGAGCESTDTVLVTVKKGPVLSANPANATICSGGTVALSVSGADSYSWNPPSGINDPSAGSVIASPLVSVNYQVTGLLANGCSASISIPVNVISKPVVNAGRDTIACTNAPNVVLTGSPSGGVWNGHPNVTSAGVFNPRTSGMGNFKLYYSFTASGCSGIDSMMVAVQDPPLANAGKDTSVCAGSGILKLSGLPSGGLWSGNSLVTSDGKFTPGTSGSFQLIYSRGTGSCIGKDTMVVTVVAAVSNNTISATQGICLGATPSQLTGSNATAGGLTVAYQWQSSTDSINWTNISNAVNKDLILQAPSSNIFYRRMAFSSVCNGGSASNVVKIFIHPDAKAVLQPGITIGCSPFNITPAVVGLVPYPDRNLTYRWYAGNNLIGAGDVFPGYVLARANDSVVIKVVAVSRFGCKNDSVSVQLKTVSNPSPSFLLSDTVGCGPLNILITNTTPDINLYTYAWDFGTGQKSTASQPGNIFFPVNPNRGDTVYQVVMRATGGCDTLRVTRSVRVRSRPRTIFTPDKAIGCSPMTVVFNNNSAGSNARFEWDFGDGSPRVPGSLASVSHTFFTGVPKTFTVRLFGTNDCGTDTADFAIVVNPNVVRLDFAVNGDELSGCSPHRVSFINNTTGANLFRWNFGDGSPVVTTNRGFDTIVHTYTDTGRYVVNLFATNGCSDTSATETILVVNDPEVSFSAIPSVVCLGDTIRFNNTSDNDLAFVWNFGDGTTSSLIQPSKRYAAPGVYRVVLTGSKQSSQGFGCLDSAAVTLTVNAPRGELVYRDGYYCAGSNVRFEVLNTNGTGFTYYFGNGDSIVTGSGQANYIYPQPGAYVPSVKVSFGGCSIILITGDTVKVDRVRSGFVFNMVPECGLTVVDFTDTSRAHFGIRQRQWLFGDGSSSIFRNPQKQYTIGGNYPVTLRITGNSGCSDSMRVPVNVLIQTSPVVNILGDSAACIGIPVRLTGDNPGGFATTLNWQVEGGVPANGNTLTQTWMQAGLYNVRLIGLTSFGCADTANLAVRVNPSPVVNAGPDERICIGNSVRLNVLTTAPLLWSPVSGLSCTNCSSPVATPTQTTQYMVSGTNSFGCTIRDTIIVYVANPFNISVSPNDTLCASNGESAQLFASNAYRYEWSPSSGLNASGIPNPVATPASTTTYRVIGFDQDNCFTDTAFVTVAVGYNPSVSIPGGGLVMAGTQVAFNPAYSGGPFKRFTWTPATDLSCSDCSDPVAIINNNISYRLSVENIFGCTASDTVTYTVECNREQVYIPNAFSPDGDGINDLLMVRGKGIANIKSFRIFNRSGQVVFEKQNFMPNDPLAGWDGRINGVPASVDVYVYMAEVLCTAGTHFEFKGNVTLFR